MARPSPALRSIRTRRAAMRIFAAQPSPRVIGGALVLALARRARFVSWCTSAVPKDTKLARRSSVGMGDIAAVAVVVAARGVHEYAIHRWLLHAPRRTIGRVVIDPGAGHRAHHGDPDVLEDALIPPVRAAAFAGMIAVYVGAACRLLGVPARTRHSATVAAVGALGAYEWRHYVDHTGVPLRFARSRVLRTHHRAHHYVDERLDLGITSRIGDRVAARLNEARR